MMTTFTLYLKLYRSTKRSTISLEI